MLFYRTQTQLEHSTVADKKPTDFTSSRAVAQARSDQPGTADVYSRPSVDTRRGVRENGNLDTVQQTHEPQYANACS